MRLDKFICKHSDLSHRDSRWAVASGRVCVNDAVIQDARMEIDRFVRVTLDGQILQECKAHYIMLHKPPGYLSATSDPQHPTVMELMPPALRNELHIGGRLDRASTGLLILTNDGLWSRRLTEPGKKLPKVYRVATAEPIAADAEARFAEGFYFSTENLTTSPAQLLRLGEREAKVTIYEGRYHQIKRMFARVGNRVVSLHRESMGEIALDDALVPGGFRALTEAEIASV
ncbi:16S rRNA pseudouridine(516) synthase [Marinobacterium sp. YM272]|uniref:16S rRNA pseudouridine(516) synthase n=1 Tax=Marinobacterium sp. YM272 TaxID=3421654 RepID=UPI003D7FD5C5